MPGPDILPDSRLARPIGAKNINSTWWIPIACANCGASGGFVPEENMTFAFYLCNSCAEKWGPIANTYVEPDELFFRRVTEAQLEKYGRLLGHEELLKALDDANSPLAKLARDRLKDH